MTHFNHEWDTTKTPAVPVSVGDRYYAQDLNDDFNYLKHLPYEVFLQGRSLGIMIAPNDTWDNDTNSLTLSGGFGVVLQDCIELDPDEDFVIPPKTHSSPRYERIPFVDTTLVLPNDSATHYIVATPTKRSLLQRTKALFTEQYASRIRYDGVITIQDTAPTAGQILVGLCHDKEYCLLIDSNPDQCKDNIILKKWFGQSKITQDFVSVLQSYYDTAISSVTTIINIVSITDGISGIHNVIFDNCTISINNINNDSGHSTYGIISSTLNNCTISIDSINVNGGSEVYGIHESTINNCTISINNINASSGMNIGGIHESTINNCTISINNISGYMGGIISSTLNNCTISIDSINVNGAGLTGGNVFDNCIMSINNISDNGKGFTWGNFNNCTIHINTINDVGIGVNGGDFSGCVISIKRIYNNNVGIKKGSFSNCSIDIDKNSVYNSGIGVDNTSNVELCLTRITHNKVTNLSSTQGKVNVLNNIVFHMS